MIENPQKFMTETEKKEDSVSAAELKKLKRKANKAKAAQEKQNGQMQAGKQSTVYLFFK